MGMDTPKPTRETGEHDMDPAKVLLVDDEESSRFMLRECLDDVGY